MCDNDCCTEKMTEQLAKMAYERDPDHPDCWFEPSARVREAAIETLGICCPNRGAPPMDGTPPPPPPPPPEGGPNRPPVEGGTSAYRGHPSQSNALFGGVFSRTPSRPSRPPAQYYRPPQHAVAAQQPHMQRTPTVWVADSASQHSGSAVQPAPRYAPPSESEAYVDAASEPAYEAVVEDAPIAAEQHVAAERQVVVDEQFDSSPYVEAAPVAEQPLSAPRIAEPQTPAEEPVLQPVIRQPSNLTLRAQRPALITAAPQTESAADAITPADRYEATPAQPVAAPRPTLIQQPANFGNAVRRASVEEPAAYVEVLEQQAETRASDAQTSHAPTSAAGNVQVRPTAARGVQAARGVVAKVSAAAGTVQLRFAGGTQPAIGGRVTVQHNYLLTTALIGELEIVAVGSNMVTARPSNETNLSKISSGDVVVLQAR
jgi:hypothetical protein